MVFCGVRRWVCSPTLHHQIVSEQKFAIGMRGGGGAATTKYSTFQNSPSPVFVFWGECVECALYRFCGCPRDTGCGYVFLWRMPAFVSCAPCCTMLRDSFCREKMSLNHSSLQCLVAELGQGGALADRARNSLWACHNDGHALNSRDDCHMTHASCRECFCIQSPCPLRALVDLCKMKCHDVYFMYHYRNHVNYSGEKKFLGF